ALGADVDGDRQEAWRLGRAPPARELRHRLGDDGDPPADLARRALIGRVRVDEALTPEARAPGRDRPAAGRDRRYGRQGSQIFQAAAGDAAAREERAAVRLGDKRRRGFAPRRRALVPVEIVEVREEILAAARVHERMEPRQHEHARPRRPRRLVVDDQHAHGGLATRLDGPIELARQRAVELAGAGDGRATERRALEGATRARDPLELAPRKGALQARGRPGTHVEESVPRARDPVGVEPAVALDDQRGVVPETDTLPARMMRQQHEIRSAQGQSPHVSPQRIVSMPPRTLTRLAGHVKAPYTRAMGDVGLMGMHVPGMSWRETREAAVLAEEL